MKKKITETLFECLEILGLETSSKQAKMIENEISVLLNAYEAELQEVIESRQNAKKAREEAIRLACADLIGAGVLPFLARQKAEQEKLEYERAKKFSAEAQKIEYFLRFWQDAKNAGGVLSLLSNDKEGRYDITIKSFVALYKATKESD